MALSPECQKPSNSTVITEEAGSGDVFSEQPRNAVHDGVSSVLTL